MVHTYTHMYTCLLHPPLLTPQQHMGYRVLVDPATEFYATQKIYG